MRKRHEGTFHWREYTDGKKYMKRWSILGIRQIQTRTTTSYHYTPIKMARIKKIVTTPNASDDAKKLDHWVAGENVKWYNYFGKQLGILLKKKK